MSDYNNNYPNSQSKQPQSSWSSSSYSDFPSSSYSSYSTFQDPKSNKSDQQSFHSYSNSFPNYPQLNNTSFEPSSTYNDKDSSNTHNDKDHNIYSAHEQRNMKNTFDDDLHYGTQGTLHSEAQGQTPVSRESIKGNTKQTQLPNKKLQDFVIRDILQLPLSRQQYLKTLSVNQLSEQAQFKYLFNKPDTVFLIGYHYKKDIANPQLQQNIVKLKSRNDLTGTFLFVSLLGYVFGASYLQKKSPYFKDFMKKGYHIAIPFGLIIITTWMEGRVTSKRRQMLEDENIKSEFRKVVRKYLCQTNQKQRRTIIKKQLTEKDQ